MRAVLFSFHPHSPRNAVSVLQTQKISTFCCLFEPMEKLRWQKHTEPQCCRVWVSKQKWNGKLKQRTRHFCYEYKSEVFKVQYQIQTFVIKLSTLIFHLFIYFCFFCRMLKLSVLTECVIYFVLAVMGWQLPLKQPTLTQIQCKSIEVWWTKNCDLINLFIWLMNTASTHLTTIMNK